MKKEPIPTALTIAHRIRTLRKEKRWSLCRMASMSEGAFTASALGSYERGDRTVTVQKLQQIADLFAVPMAHLIGIEEKDAPSGDQGRLIVDMRRARNLESIAVSDPKLSNILNFIACIARRRCDWNGEVLSVRAADLTSLSILASIKEERLIHWLNQMQLLITVPDHP